MQIALHIISDVRHRLEIIRKDGDRQGQEETVL
jgi:hypothetical protein